MYRRRCIYPCVHTTKSYNNLAHIPEKDWKYLIRIKNGKLGIICGFDLPDSNEFDLFFPLLLFRRNTREAKALSRDKNRYRYVHNNSRFDFLPTTTRKHDPFFFYELPIRIIRFKIANDVSKTIVTNLDADNFPPGEVKRLYALRWGMETSFRDLKYIIGLLLLLGRFVSAFSSCPNLYRRNESSFVVPSPFK